MTRRSVRRRPLWVAAALFASLVFITPALAARPLVLGFDADGPLSSGSPQVQARSLALAHADGARFVRLTASWAGIAPARRPSGFQASDPASPGYSFSALDADVRANAAAHITSLLLIYAAPTWAEGADRPASAPPGTWRPNPSQLGQFAAALAKRYSGTFPDPLRAGHTLPRVRDFEVWDEPNLDENLTPQWVGTTATSPTIYRNMVNAVYAAVKRVAPSDLIVAGATAPFGDPYPGGARIPPVEFDRYMLCLGRPRSGCGEPIHFDALDHHPYSIGAPTQPADDAGDVSVADLHKLTALLKQAARARTVLPAGPKQVWVTELAWASDPPDPTGVPAQTQARYLEQSLFLLWRQGVDTVLWLQFADDPGPASTALQTGIYYANGKPKPAVSSFKFPFVTQRVSAGKIEAWAIASGTGTLLIQRRSGRGWVTIRTSRVVHPGVVDQPVPLAGKATLRARLGGEISLTWSQS